MDHRITISEQLNPGFLELQRTIQKCMPLNNALTIQGYAEKNQEQLDNDPLYLEGIDNAKKKNALRDTGKIGKIEPPKDGSILYKAITEKVSVVCFFQEALAKELYSKNKILTSLIKLKQQDFLDELWLHNTVMNLFRVLKKFNMSEEYQKNPSNVELLNAYFSLLNTIRSNFYHTSFIVKILAAESFLFLSEHRINDFESITERLAFFISYIRKFFDLSHELAFFIKEFALFANVIDSNKGFVKKLLDISKELSEMKTIFQGLISKRCTDDQDLIDAIKSSFIDPTKPLSLDTIGRLKDGGFVKIGMTVLEVQQGYLRYNENKKKRGPKPKE